MVDTKARMTPQYLSILPRVTLSCEVPFDDCENCSTAVFDVMNNKSFCVNKDKTLYIQCERCKRLISISLKIDLRIRGWKEDR